MARGSVTAPCNAITGNVCVSMCARMRVCVCVCVCVCDIHTHKRTHTYIYMYLHIYTCIYMYVHRKRTHYSPGTLVLIVQKKTLKKT